MRAPDPLHLHQTRLAASSLRRSIKRAIKFWEQAQEASLVGVTRIGGDAIVADLPPRTFPLIAAQVETAHLPTQIAVLRELFDRRRESEGTCDG